MTFDDLCTALRGTTGWYLGREGQIRRRVPLHKVATGAEECPICAFHETLCVSASIAGVYLGLADLLVIEIIHAADNHRRHDPSIRQALLEACGITKEEEARDQAAPVG